MIKWHEASDLLLAYIKRKIGEQFKSVSFIILFLGFFQTVVLGLPIEELPKVLLGISLVIFGLTLFMEGLFLGIMPIGEALGIKLPAKAPIFLTLLFSLFLGIGATYAEPSLNILRSMGANVSIQDAPLLYYMLNIKTPVLITSIALGVGLAVLLGVLRFLYTVPLLYFILPITILALALSCYGWMTPNFGQILGLAWDCGAVTTGPVTVPLVLALGLGMTRVISSQASEGNSSGFGVVTLASLLPVISVLILGLYYHQHDDFKSWAQNPVQAEVQIENVTPGDGTPSIREILDSENIQLNLKNALQAILPLCLFIFIIFRFILGEKFPFPDEIVLGVVLSVLGLGIFNIGIESGIGKLGKQLGASLPATYSSINLTDKNLIIPDFEMENLNERYLKDGSKERFFYLNDGKQVRSIIFDNKYYDPINKTYTYSLNYGPLWGEGNFNILGVTIVLVFSFFMGLGATLAEPALNALGAKIEDISVGTFKKELLIKTVAVGVGIGIAFGVGKIIWNLPIIIFLLPCYLLALFLSIKSSEEFINIAWDAAGVTTGPVTVPLVLAIGLGIGSNSSSIEGFGILSLASVMPVLSVLAMGLWVKHQEKYWLEPEENSNRGKKA